MVEKVRHQQFVEIDAELMELSEFQSPFTYSTWILAWIIIKLSTKIVQANRMEYYYSS